MRRLPCVLPVIGAIAAAASAEAATPPAVVASCRAFAQEAAIRSQMPIGVILRVMRVESDGMPSAVSPKGAMGCMQIMPATWGYLSRRYGLSDNPYDARMNMIGGALYLAELSRRFGLPGAFAAYSAGEARYVRHLAGGAPLPAETVAYVARLGGTPAPAIATDPQARWQEARLFLTDAYESSRSGAPLGVLPATTPKRTSAVTHAASTLLPLADAMLGGH